MLLRPLPILARPIPFRFLTHAQPLIIAFGFSLPFFTPSGCTLTKYDTSPYSTSPSSSYTHSRDAKPPLTTDGRTLNPAAVKQISLGSILGLGAGILLSAFSRSLTLLLGLGIVVWQVRSLPSPRGRVQLSRSSDGENYTLTDSCDSGLRGEDTTSCRRTKCRNTCRALMCGARSMTMRRLRLVSG